MSRHLVPTWCHRQTHRMSIKEVQMDVGLIRQDLDKVRSRLTTADNRVGLVEDAVGDNTGAICTLQSRVKLLEHGAEDSENRC